MSWWAAILNPKGLSQGDIVADLPIGMANAPMAYLERSAVQAKGKRNWPETSKLEPYRTDGNGLYISRGRLRPAIVVSHSCELDKREDSRVLVAPIASLSQVENPNDRARILERKRRALMPLPELPGLGDQYADLRCIMYVNRELVPEGSRKFSMSDEGVAMLQAQLIAFLTRLDPDPLVDALAAGVARQNAPG